MLRPRTSQSMAYDAAGLRLIYFQRNNGGSIDEIVINRGAALAPHSALHVWHRSRHMLCAYVMCVCMCCVRFVCVRAPEHDARRMCDDFSGDQSSSSSETNFAHCDCHGGYDGALRSPNTNKTACSPAETRAPDGRLRQTAARKYAFPNTRCNGRPTQNKLTLFTICLSAESPCAARNQRSLRAVQAAEPAAAVRPHIDDSTRPPSLQQSAVRPPAAAGRLVGPVRLVAARLHVIVDHLIAARVAQQQRQQCDGHVGLDGRLGEHPRDQRVGEHHPARTEHTDAGGAEPQRVDDRLTAAPGATVNPAPAAPAAASPPVIAASRLGSRRGAAAADAARPQRHSAAQKARKLNGGKLTHGVIDFGHVCHSFGERRSRRRARTRVFSLNSSKRT